MTRFLVLMLVSIVVACAPRSNAVMLPGQIPPRWGSPEWFVFVRHLRDSLSAADPVSDAQTAIGRGDFHLLGIIGYGLAVPGREKDWPKYKPRVYILPAGGDAIQGPDHLDYMHAAHRYAAAYNNTILAHAERRP